MAMYRYSDPVVLQHVWNAIEIIRGQRQIANICRITKIMHKETSFTAKEILHHIHRAVKDSMVVETISVGCKGSKAGKEQEGYWIPEDLHAVDMDKDHDWYCFLCHRPGEMLTCNTCSKSYHKKCIKTMSRFKDTNKVKVIGQLRKWFCEYCQINCNASPLLGISKRNLNICLGFVARAISEEAPELILNPDPKDHPQFDYFIKERKCMHDVIKACEENKFEIPEEFLCLVDLIAHNCNILHGSKHEFTIAAEKMVNVCDREIKELFLCKNCYFMSNAKPTKDWFCAPCKPPHYLVWAKQKGFEYWPAKVMQVDGGKADVRFFGSRHERAWVVTDNLKNIIISPSDLQIRMSKGWIKANNEMKEYIRQTEKMYGSKDAAQIVKFDHRIVKPKKNNLQEKTKQKVPGAFTIEEDYLRKRFEKHHAEIAEHKSNKAKRKASELGESRKNLLTAEEKRVKINPTNEEEQINIVDVQTSDLYRCGVEGEWKVQLQVFGPKAKLREECARTWPHASFLIRSGLFRVGYKPSHVDHAVLSHFSKDKSTQTITSPSLQMKNPDFVLLGTGTKNKCKCKKRYEHLLKRYKSCASKMMKQEKEEIMKVSALYIRQHLTEEHKRMSILAAENKALKEEIEFLKNQQSSST